MESSVPDKSDRSLAELVPTSWLDPLLTGSGAVLPAVGETVTLEHVAELLRRLKKRIEDAEAEYPFHLTMDTYHEFLSYRAECLLRKTAPSAKNAPWINPAHQFPDEGQEVRFMPLSGNVFNGWYTNDLKTGNPHIDGASAFVRGDGASKIMHASYTPSVVMWWMPLPSAPTDGKGDTNGKL